jgi:HTH-type transcriptional regulator/antitoxin HigA
MQIKPIRTKADYRNALKEIETLMPAQAGTPEGERLDVLATLVEAYERKQFPMDLGGTKDRPDRDRLTVRFEQFKTRN